MNLKKILFKHQIEASLQVYVVSKKGLKGRVSYTIM